jgi:HEAT repeat protein
MQFMRRSDLASLAARSAPTVLFLVGLAACQSATSHREQLAFGTPVDQVRAAVWLAESGDAEAVHTLVGLLEDRDRTVRMYAILALRRLCGESYGYEYYASETQRQAAVMRWQTALRDGVVTLRTAPAGEGPDAGAAPPQDAEPAGPAAGSAARTQPVEGGQS